MEPCSGLRHHPNRQYYSLRHIHLFYVFQFYRLVFGSIQVIIDSEDFEGGDLSVGASGMFSRSGFIICSSAPSGRPPAPFCSPRVRSVYGLGYREFRIKPRYALCWNWVLVLSFLLLRLAPPFPSSCAIRSHFYRNQFEVGSRLDYDINGNRVADKRDLYAHALDIIGHVYIYVTVTKIN
jgi:hypothetical protein